MTTSTHQPAPTIAELVANPEEMKERANIPFYFYEYPGTEDDPYRRFSSNASYQATNEAHALQNFVDTTGELADMLQKRNSFPHAYRAKNLLQGVRFIGRQALIDAAEVKATRWTELLRGSNTGMLFAGINPNASNILVYDTVIQALEKRGIDTSNIHAVCLDSINSRSEEASQHRRVIADSGAFVLPDDWIVSGDQFGRIVTNAVDNGFKPEELEIQVVAATKKHIANGIGGAAVYTLLTHEYSPVDDNASLTGNHGSVDYGMVFHFQSIWNKVTNLYDHGMIPQMPALPILRSVAPTYKTWSAMSGSAEYALKQPAFATFREQRARCEAIAANLLSLDDGSWPQYVRPANSEDDPA